MKLIVICIVVILLSSCGIVTTGEGVFNGRIVDVTWEGLFFESCEVDFQLGNQSSTLSSGSTTNKELCNNLKNNIGQVVTVKYKIFAIPCCLRTDTRYEILN